MFAPLLLIYEKTPRWGPELKRHFLGSGVTSRVASALADVDKQITAHPQSLLVLDLGAGAGECLRFVARARQTGLSVRTLLVGSAQTRELEWVARELGADHFIEEDVGGGGLARLCRLYLEQLQTDRPQDDGRSATAAIRQ